MDFLRILKISIAKQTAMQRLYAYSSIYLHIYQAFYTILYIPQMGGQSLLAPLHAIVIIAMYFYTTTFFNFPMKTEIWATFLTQMLTVQRTIFSQ